MSTNKDITLYLDNRNPPPVVTVSQGDTDWLYRFTVMYNNAVYSPSVTYVILTGHKPDGHVFAYRGAKSGNLYTVTPANANGNLVQMTAVAGDVPCELRLISGGRSVGTANFILRVEPGPEGVVTVASASALNAYTTILQELGVLIGKVETLPDDVPGWIGDWLEEHISGGQGVAVDNTLTVQGAAADAKATGDRLTALEEATIETDDTLTVAGAAADAKAVGDVLGVGSFTLGTPDSWRRQSIVGGNRVDSTKIIAMAGFLPRSVTHVTCAEGYASLIYRYTAGGEYVGFWKDNDFATSGSGTFRQEFDIPQDSYRYVLTMKKTDGADITTAGAVNITSDADGQSAEGLIQRVEALEEALDDVQVTTDTTLRIEGKPADAKAVGDLLFGYDTGGDGEPQDLDPSPWTVGKSISNTGAVSDARGGAISTPIICEPGTTFTLTGPLQDGNGVDLWTYVHEFSAGGVWLRRANFNSVVSQITVGADCHQVRFGFLRNNSTGVAMTQTDIDTYFGVTDGSSGSQTHTAGLIERVDALEVLALGLHTAPENKGVLNLIKRCRQLTDIKWTPAVDLPRFMLPSISPGGSGDYSSSQISNYIGVFKAGVQYTGIPYGRCTEYLTSYGMSNSYVGLGASIETFITAVRNAKSLVSLESQGNISGHRSVPYAAVCSALTCYALNVAYRDTSGIPSIPGLSAVGPLVSDGVHMDAKNIKLGDVLNLSNYHTAIITDIVKDDDGEVTAVEISEATTVGEANPDIEGGQVGGLCRRHGVEIEEFFARWGSYTLYRYSGIASIPYTPSPFVNVGDELNYSHLEDLPCMPYPGEGFVYHAGSIPNTKILVSASGFGFMRVFKDGTEISGSPFAIASGAEYVEVGFSAVGSYEAYLCNMSNGSNTKVTAKCHWSVV